VEVCYIFPGQGSQSIGMGKNIYDRYFFSRKIFHTGNEILGFDITDLMFNGPEEELTKTINCQPAILISNLAYFSALQKHIPCSLTLGHSVGEYSALVASNALSLEDAIRLVKIRAELMSKCIPDEKIKNSTSHMAAVITTNLDLVYEACERHSFLGSIVQVANINSPSQIVISGNNDAIIRTVEYLKDKDIKKVVYLKIEGPFHSEIMMPAAEGMKKALEDIIIKEPTIPYIANYSADFVYEPDQIKQILVKQIYGTVKWMQSLEKAIQKGFKIFVESGSGNIQTNLLKKDYREVKVLDNKDII